MSAQPEPEKEINKWELYEQRKAELPKDLTPEEYRNAVKKIAYELGL